MTIETQDIHHSYMKEQRHVQSIQFIGMAGARKGGKGRAWVWVSFPLDIRSTADILKWHTNENYWTIRWLTMFSKGMYQQTVKELQCVICRVTSHSICTLYLIVIHSICFVWSWKLGQIPSLLVVAACCFLSSVYDIQTADIDTLVSVRTLCNL